jgi:4-amino-4-deoxy-L-arabinose transferase-like glycosyltransferase
LVVVVGIVLRVLYLGEPPRKDESYTYVVFAGRSIVHALTLYPAPNNHILHTAFVWISCRLFGNSLWAMRLPALLAGVALIPATYITAMRLAGRNAALFAAGLIAVSGPFVYFSVNARGYAQQAVLTVIMLYLAAELVEGAPAVYWALLSAAAAAGFWTAPTMLYSYLVVSFWLLWAGGRVVLRPMIIAGTITALTVAFLYMPVIVVAGPRALLWNPFVRPQPLQEFRADALGFPKRLLTFLHGGDPLAFVILIAVGVLLALVSKTSAGRRPAAQLFVVLLVVLVGLPALQRIVPFARALLPVLIVYYLLAAFGWSLAAEKPFALHEVPMLIAFLTLLAAVAFHLTRSGYIEANRQFPESRDVAAYLATQLHPSDRLIISWSAGPQLSWQLQHNNVPYVEYSRDTAVPGRVFVALQDISVLPPRTSRLDPSLLTFEGTLRDAGLNSTDYQPASLTYKSGKGEVFELTPRHNSK